MPYEFSIVCRSVLSAIGVMSLITASMAQDGIVITYDSNLQFDEKIELVVNQQDTEAADIYSGIRIDGAYTAIIKSPDIAFTGGVSAPDRAYFIYLKENNSSLTTNSNLSGNAEGNLIRGFVLDGDVLLNVNGDVDFSMTSTGASSNAPGMGMRAVNGASAKIEGDKFHIVSNGSDVRGLYIGNSNVNITADDIYIENNATEEGSNNQGVWINQSTLTLNGNKTTFVLNGEGIHNRGINLNADQTGKTEVNVNSNELVLDINGRNNESYAVFSSGTTAVINVASAKVGIDVTDDSAIGLYAQYGGRINFLDNSTQIDIAVHGIEQAIGILNSTYGGKTTFQFGSINIAGDVSIDVEATGDAIGVANQIYPGDSVHLYAEGDGVYLNGNTVIRAASNSSDGAAVGILADNTTYDSSAETPNAITSINNLLVDSIGNNGASSYGITVQNNGHLILMGDAEVTATGDSAVGMSVSAADVTIQKTAVINGDTEGVVMDENSLVSIVKDASLVSNTLQNEGKISLEANALLDVKGEENGSSSLGNIEGTNATIALGAGSFTSSEISGSNNTLLLNNLSAIDSIAIDDASNLNVVASASSNDSFDSGAEAFNSLTKKVTITSGENDTYQVLEGAVNDGVTGTKNSDGTWTTTVQANEKLSAFSSLSALSFVQWRDQMNDLNKRMGDLRDTPNAVGTWVRLYGSEQEYGQLTAKNTTIQLGADYQIGSWKLGGAFSYTDGSSTYDAGDADNKIYTFAVYGTWLADNGMYADLIAKYGRLSNDFKLNGMDGDFDNNAYSLSAEFGWRFEPCSFAFIEPQAELSWGRVQGDSFSTANGVRVEQDDFDSLIARVGVRVGAKFPENRGNIYLRVSGAYDFEGDNDAYVRSLTGTASRKLHDDLGGGWIETAVGGNFRVTDSTNVYVDFERNNGGEIVENWRWNVGLRHVW